MINLAAVLPPNTLLLLLAQSVSLVVHLAECDPASFCLHQKLKTCFDVDENSVSISSAGSSRHACDWN